MSLRISVWLIIFVFSASLAHAAPSRVVSLSVCTDQLLLAVARPEQIAALTRLAASREISAYADEAERLPVHQGRTEELLTLKPDLVLVDDWTPVATQAMLDKLNLPVLKLPTLQSLDELPDTLIRLGDALGREEAAYFLLKDWPPSPALPSDAPLAAFYRPNGYSPGLETPQHSALKVAGWRNLSADLGMHGSLSLDLERFIYFQPKLWVQDVKPRKSFGLGDTLMSHPALQQLAIPTQEVALHSWFCITPRTMDAVRALQARRNEI